MGKRALGDPETYPSPEVIASRLGKANASFEAMLEHNRGERPDFEERWKFYNDGKSKLFNVSRKKKTLFWLSVEEGFFRTTFYLNPEGWEALLGSDLPEELKDQYRAAKGKKDHTAYKELLAIKMASM
jgi:hypothetical protein